MKKLKSHYFCHILEARSKSFVLPAHSEGSLQVWRSSRLKSWGRPKVLLMHLKSRFSQRTLPRYLPSSLSHSISSCVLSLHSLTGLVVKHILERPKTALRDTAKLLFPKDRDQYIFPKASARKKIKTFFWPT